MRNARISSLRRWVAGLAMLLPVAPLGASGAAESERIPIESVEVAVSTVGPVVLLKALGKAVPVLVDQTVAQSIHAALNRQQLPRPLSHDLMRGILSAYGGRVTQVVVTLKGATYHGALSIELQGETKVFDSRSSDAIALAIHFSAPILVGRDLMERAGQELPAPPGSQRL
jgi:bifunctional DNase/RNase